MQMHAALDLENLPDSPYASELRRDFPDLRFSPELEKEFQTFHLERVRARVLGILEALSFEARICRRLGRLRHCVRVFRSDVLSLRQAL